MNKQYKIVRCCVCGGNAYNRRHWPNRESGHSVCIDCFECEMRDLGRDEARKSYGVAGVHWGADQPERAKSLFGK